MAKSMAGGFPISAVVGRAEVMDAPAPGGLGGTYAGSPVACAAALAVLDVFAKENLLERSRKLGEHLRSQPQDHGRQTALHCRGTWPGRHGGDRAVQKRRRDTNPMPI